MHAKIIINTDGHSDLGTTIIVDIRLRYVFFFFPCQKLNLGMGMGCLVVARFNGFGEKSKEGGWGRQWLL